MPTYTLFNEQAGVEYEDFLTIEEYEQLLKDSPFIKRVWDSAPAIVGDHMMGVGPKVDGGLMKTCHELQRLILALLCQTVMVNLQLKILKLGRFLKNTVRFSIYSYGAGEKSYFSTDAQRHGSLEVNPPMHQRGGN